MQLQLNLLPVRVLSFVCLVCRIFYAFKVHGNGWRNGWRSFGAVPSEDTASSTSVMTPEADKIASLAELIIKKVESGSFDELKAAGMRVSNVPTTNKEVTADVKPPFDESDEDLDSELIARLMRDISFDNTTEAVVNIEQQPWFATVENYRQQLLSSSKSDVAKRAFSQPSDITSNSNKQGGSFNELLLDGSSQLGSTGEAPMFVEMLEQKSQQKPATQSLADRIATMGEMEDDLMEFDEEDENADNFDEPTQLADQTEVAALTDTPSNTKTDKMDIMNLKEGKESEADDLQREINAANFAELLKASLEDNNEKMTEEELASAVTEDIQAGKTLDLRSFVGGTLFSIAEAMQINLTEEIQSSSEIQAELTKLLQGNTAELDKNMLSIDEQSAKLMETLNSMQLELLEEEKVFEASKQDEFDKLFSKQTTAQSDLIRSREEFERKAMKLQELIKGFNENADLLTFFAMFPLKPDDQKLIFVLGLSMTLKTMFDLFIAQMMQLPNLAFDMTDPSDISKVAVQLAVVAVAFNYTGVWRAIFNTLTGKTGIKGLDKKDVL